MELKRVGMVCREVKVTGRGTRKAAAGAAGRTSGLPAAPISPFFL